MWTVADFETCALEKSSSSDSGRWLFISTLNFLQSSGAVAVTQKGEILSECQHYVTSPYSKYSFTIEHLHKWKFSLLISSEWAWQTVLFVCFSKWMLLPSYFLIYCQCLVLTTVWRLKQWWKYFLFSLTDVADKGANGSTVCCGSNSLESFTPITCLSQKKVQVALVTLYTEVIFAWMYSLIREQKFICIFAEGLHFLRVGEFDELEVNLFRSLSLKQINEHASEQRNTLLLLY